MLNNNGNINKSLPLSHVVEKKLVFFLSICQLETNKSILKLNTTQFVFFRPLD